MNKPNNPHNGDCYLYYDKKVKEFYWAHKEGIRLSIEETRQLYPTLLTDEMIEKCKQGYMEWHPEEFAKEVSAQS